MFFFNRILILLSLTSTVFLVFFKPPSPSSISDEETFGLQITREVEITNDEFEYLATGEVPQLPTGPAAPLLFRAMSRRRRLSAAAEQQQELQQQHEEEKEEVAASASAQHRQGRKNLLGGKHRHLFSAGLPAGGEAAHRRGGGGHDHDGAGDDYAYSAYYRKQAEHHASAEARKAERRNMRGAGLFAPWGRAATSAREPYALFDPARRPAPRRGSSAAGRCCCCRSCTRTRWSRDARGCSSRCSTAPTPRLWSPLRSRTSLRGSTLSGPVSDAFFCTFFLFSD